MAQGTDTFALPNSGIPAGSTINSVTVYNRKKSIHSSASVRTVIRTYSTNYQSDANNDPDWIEISTEYTTNPNTSSAWSIAEVNAMEIGTKAIGGSMPGRDAIVTQVWAVINYDPPPETGRENHSGFNALGDIIFTNAGAGLCYGSMGQENVPTTVTIVTAGVAVILDGMTGGEVNNVTFQNSQELKVTFAGKYFISWAVSFNMASGSGQEVEGKIGIDGAGQSAGSAHRTIGTGNDTGSMCGTAILDLEADEKVTIMIENEGTTVDVVVAHASLILTQVGN